MGNSEKQLLHARLAVGMPEGEGIDSERACKIVDGASSRAEPQSETEVGVGVLLGEMELPKAKVVAQEGTIVGRQSAGEVHAAVESEIEVGVVGPDDAVEDFVTESAVEDQVAVVVVVETELSHLGANRSRERCIVGHTAIDMHGEGGFA